MQQFGDGAAAAVATAATLAAALGADELPAGHALAGQARTVQGVVVDFARRGAVRAGQADQALGQHRIERGDEAVGVDLHLAEAADHIEHVVGVDGGEHQVAGKRRLHGDLRGVRVADLADHDLVRVVTQDRAQAAGEGQALLLVDRDLQHAGELVFHRVFDGDDLVHAVVDLGDHGVQRGGLAAAGGAGDQDHAVGLGGQAAQGTQGFIGKAQGLQLHAADSVGQVLFVEHPQHGVFTEDAGHDRHPEVDLALAYGNLEAAILGHALFTDVQLGHDLDARNHLVGEGAATGLAGRVEHAVDAVLDGQALAGHAQVDIAGVQLEGVVEGGVDQLDHPALVFADAGQRQALQRVAFAAGFAVVVKGIDGMEAFFVAGQKRRQLGGVGQVQRRALQHIVDPGQAGVVEGVGEHTQQFTALLYQHELALQALGQADLVETRGAGQQALAVQYRVMQGAAQAADEGVGGVAGEAFEAVEQALAAGLQAGLGHEIAGVA
ncbi:hypothetical protein D3C78_488280 [compost metagenome]